MDKLVTTVCSLQDSRITISFRTFNDFFLLNYVGTVILVFENIVLRRLLMLLSQSLRVTLDTYSNQVKAMFNNDHCI